MMKTNILGTVLLMALAKLLCAAPEEPNLMTGKQKTDRTIVLDALVDAPPHEVFRLWTSAEGIKEFFAPDARVDAEAGGRYQVIFAPAKDPEGDSHGTKGARILKFVPDKELAFEWITFAGDELLGRNAPPYAAPAERNVRPLPTWVEMTFEAVEGQPNQTHVRFAHYGFREGEKWEESYRWFGRAWKGVLDELVAYCQNRKSTAAKN
jgi:uncharacterized protein YndB with AHSA1/START domain